MERPINMHMVINMQADAKAWAVYELRDTATAELLYIGVNRLANIMTLNDLNTNPGFDRSRNYIFTLASVHESKTLAVKARYIRMTNNGQMPILNRQASRGRGHVQCMDTGEIFTTQYEAAQHHGIDPGALGRHLAGRPYHNTVKGRTYRFVQPQK